jgi:hypothetical protein
MKILFIRHKGCNLFFFDKVLKHISAKNIKVKIVDLKRFSRDVFSCAEDWTIIYQTFPGETSSERRFQRQMIERADLKFLNLKNKNKILFDSHDNGEEDGFSRFILHSANYNIKDPLLRKRALELGEDYFLKIPRIKTTPSKNYLNKLNVVLQTTWCWDENIEVDFNKERKYLLHYWANDSHNILGIRQKLRAEINDLKDKLNINISKIPHYPGGLRDVLCEISSPGYGLTRTRGDIDSLNQGCLLFLHETGKDIRLIPYAELIPDEDYICYNFENIEDKLTSIINNKDEVDRIRKNGHKKLMESFSIKKCADIFTEYLKTLK